MQQGEDEQELLTRLRSGDESAYAELVRSHGGRLLAVARRIVRNEADAQDVVQEAFLSAFRGLDGFSGQSRLGTWLHRIAVNAALMRLRRQERRADRPISDLLPRFSADDHQAEPAASWTPALEHLQTQELRAMVRQAIDELPDSYRTVLMLRDIEELDTEETARQLQVSVGVVKTRLHRARQALRTLLDARFRGGHA
jgi:RNA polymerase sigma-70 factor (ECF subfamily)